MSRACCAGQTHSFLAGAFLSEGSYHVNDFEVAVRESDGVGRGGHRQHEGQRGSDGAGEHDVQWVYPDGCGLQESNKKVSRYKKRDSFRLQCKNHQVKM